ncbi:N-formylglutamate amidohydrolase [Parvularcula maris]|uniref:N-formylglutamate amidohydrolase n=1 Tax=Parvularcula maris TaxID=2965077 RepID=A0A9X2LBT7_9PROT|nr:N-formylglutamate amidohydrolase [Parvularcula maris]MCQ8185677.1 N-formylglutamate amidohydrolase [Parvularcula maris]
MVARIVKQNYPSHVVERPSSWRHPYLFCCPHAGRDYPRRLLSMSPLPLETLRRSEDAYVDQLIPSFAKELVPTVHAHFPRLFVDVNRSPRELDPGLFSGQVDPGPLTRSSRVVAGFGVIPKLAADGRSIYGSRLPSSEAKSRLKQCFHPYHDDVSALAEEARERFGRVLIVDWHSMPSSAGGQQKLADIVLGDLFGASCSEEDTGLWEDAFMREGFKVARNQPYAGGFVASNYGKPREGIGVLQIEINRGLYMNERRVARNAGFQTTARRIEQVVDRVLLASAPGAIAAE